MIDSGLIKFYGRYVEDTLVLAKPEHFDAILCQLNSFHSNLCFMIDKFEDDNVHFLDISLDRTTSDIYRKDTNTGQYVSFTSDKPWPRKIVWARALFHRASRICNNDSLFQKQISVIKTFLSWNGFPRAVASNLINRFMCSGSEPRSSNTDTSKIIWLGPPYAGHMAESIVNRLVRKLKRCFREPARFKILYQTKKFSSFCSNKDPTPMYLKSHVIYKPTCPACNAECIGKTDRCLRVPLDEHS